MVVSLMSLLGGNVNLSAVTGSEGAATAELNANGNVAFDAIMADSGLQDISAEQLRAFFVARGKEVPAALQNSQNVNAGQILAHIVAANDGKKLPGGVMMALQEVLPQNVMEAVEQTLANIQHPVDGEHADVLAALPQRELTPEELSELVQETGLPPIVIFAALQDTPAASPNLAHAMVEDMGAAEADANLPLPRMHPLHGEVPMEGEHAAEGEIFSASLQTGTKEQVAIKPETDTPLAKTEIGARLSSEIAAVDFSAMDESKRDVIKRIVDVLRGEKAQAEFDWSVKAMPVAASGNEKVAQIASKMDANARANAPIANAPAANATAEVVAFTATNGKSADAPLALQANVQANTQTSADLQQVQMNTMADAAKAAPQTASQTTDGPQQAPNFAFSLEQSSALRGAGTADSLAAHLRQPATQAGNPVEQVAVHVGKALADGSSKMEIHLKPNELGRVEVRIETDADGRSHVVVTADKRDTLDMLQRDARGLERALADAGLKTDSNSLSFNLRGGDSQQHAQDERNGHNAKPAFDMNGNYAELDEKLGESEMALTYDAGRAYRLNLDRGVDISV